MKIPNIPEGAIDKLIKVGVATAIFFIGKKMLKDKAEDSADSQIDTNPSAGQARSLNAAMNPSGYAWMRSMDGTNTDAIYAIAPQITNLDAVKDFYKAQTQGRVLHEDLINELGAEGYDKFLAIATKGKSGSPKYSTTRTDIPANLWVLTSAIAYVRSTPKKQSNLSPGNNIIKLVSKGRSIGITTGKYAYDEPNDVTFIEFFTLGAKDNIKHFFYIAKSQVELLNKAEKDKREKTGKLPYEFLAGFSGSTDQEQKQIVTIRPTMIYTEQFKSLQTIPSNLIVGYPLLTLDTGKGKYIKVQTVQGNIRWIKAEDTTTQNRI
jgi:hypothetical protein